MIYGEADKANRDMNRRNLRVFSGLKLAKWDEISIVRNVGEVYDSSTTYAKRKYREIGRKAYDAALTEARASGRRRRNGADTITNDWVLDMLEEADAVTQYAFLPEKERKKQRLIETLTVTQNRNREIDKALRYWTVQVGQYFINTVDRARLQAFKDSGVKRVVWHTEEDDRVCAECAALDGRKFDVDAVPPKPHINCRCWLTAEAD